MIFHEQNSVIFQARTDQLFSTSNEETRHWQIYQARRKLQITDITIFIIVIVITIVIIISGSPVFFFSFWQIGRTTGPSEPRLRKCIVMYTSTILEQDSDNEQRLHLKNSTDVGKLNRW